MTVQPHVDPQQLFLYVVRRKKFAMPTQWTNADFMHIYLPENTATGQMGEAFVERACESLGFNVTNETYTGEYDITIDSHRFEVKTATLGVSNGFQFNNVRTKYEVDFLFCLGVEPNDILFNVYRETDVKSMEEGPYILNGCQDSVLPGHMTGMAKKADVEDNFKLWKTGRELRRIEELQAVLTALFNE